MHTRIESYNTLADDETFRAASSLRRSVTLRVRPTANSSEMASSTANRIAMAVSIVRLLLLLESAKNKESQCYVCKSKIIVCIILNIREKNM